MAKSGTKKPLFTPIAASQPRYRVVANQIAQLIRDGTLPLNQKMPPDTELVDMLQVSRATVREAMISLEMMGYVETRFGYGAYVASHLPLNVADVAAESSFFELVEARYWIEADITAVAATTITDDDLALLSALLEKMEDPGQSVEDLDRLDAEFHVGIANATQNNWFITIMGQLWQAREHFPGWARVRRQLVDTAANIETVKDEHRAVLDALKARDPVQARAAMQTHCKNFGVPFLEEWREEDNGAAFKDDIVLKIMNRMRPLD